MVSENMKVQWYMTLLIYSYVTGQIPIQTEVQPEFLAPLENLTVSQGRDAHFTCIVNNLGAYRVAWIKSDSKAILAIHTNMVALNPRLSVTYNGHNTWKLHVTSVRANDSGTFMCQVNTDPMMSQMGYLEVVIPPDIVIDMSDGGASGVALEGGSVRLRCSATGVPPPSVTWKRHGARDIVFRHDGGREKLAIPSYNGEILHLAHVQRADAGAYYCIATNGVPPSVSRRYYVHVHFPPVIKLSTQLVAAPVSSDVHLQCYVEASPNAMNSWYRDNGDKLLEKDKYYISETALAEYSLYMNLTIKAVDKKDFGGYVCSSVNALGRTEGNVRLQELQLPLSMLPTYSPTSRVTHNMRKHQKKPGERNNKDGRANSKNYRTDDTTFYPILGMMSTEDSNMLWHLEAPPWTNSVNALRLDLCILLVNLIFIGVILF